MLANKIKGFIKIKDLTLPEVQKKLGLKYSTGLQARFSSNSFKSDQLIKIAELGNCYLALIDKDTKEVVVKFDKDDIPQSKK